MQPPAVAEESVLRPLALESFAEDPPAVAVEKRPRGVCRAQNVVLDFHVWTEDLRRCARCGFTRGA